MFYSVQLLGKSSPLGKLWLAAHADKRLKRQDINSTDVPQSVEQIIQSEDNDNQLPLALRLSGLLLLGLVKIYSRQLQYLQEDCLTAVQELDKADRVVGQKGHNKQQKARAALANQADVTVPDEPHQLFRFSSLSDEEGFGLFEENHAGLAMAAEAHASFMNLEFSLSQSDAHDESAMVHLDEPEQLRAVPGGFDNEVEPTLPIGDELPRMTPTKRLGRSFSRDVSPDSPGTGKPVSTLASAAQRESADEELVPVPLPMNDMLDLPPIVRPSSTSDASPASQAGTPTARASAPQHDVGEVRSNQDQVCEPSVDSQPDALPEPMPDCSTEPMSDSVPDHIQELAPDAMPDLGPESVPDAGSVPDAMGKVTIDAPGVLEIGVELGDMPLQKEMEPRPTVCSSDIDNVDSAHQHPANGTRPFKRKRGKHKSFIHPVGPKVTRKRTVPKLRKDADNNATTIAHNEVRELLKNRSSLICKLPPLVSENRRFSRYSNSEDLDGLMAPADIQQPSLDHRMLRLFEAIGSCRPVSLQALRGDSGHTINIEDETEDAILTVKVARPDATVIAAPMQPEVLRDAETYLSGSHGSHGVPPNSPQAGLVEDERDEVQGDEVMQVEDGGLREIDADLPDMDVPDMELPAMDMPASETPDVPFEVPPVRRNSDLAGQGPDAHPDSTGVQDHDTDAHVPEELVPEEHTPVETLYSVPGTQGTGGAEDSSLNAHTIRTLQRLEMISKSRCLTRKRKLPQIIPMSELVQSMDRPEGAKLFYDVLVLQAKGIIQLHKQNHPYAELQMVLHQ